jgi:hypothetical protein
MGEEAMERMNRRSVLALGIAAMTAPVLTSSRSAVAQTSYGPDEGKELLPGVRQVDLGERPAIIPGYTTVSMRDIVVEPNAEVPAFPMENDMVCHMTEGELMIVQDGVEFTARKGHVWTCATGTEEGGKNAGASVAIMRVIDLLRA